MVQWVEGDPGRGNCLCTDPKARKKDEKEAELRLCSPGEKLDCPLSVLGSCGRGLLQGPGAWWPSQCPSL